MIKKRSRMQILNADQENVMIPSSIAYEYVKVGDIEEFRTSLYCEVRMILNVPEASMKYPVSISTSTGERGKVQV